MRDLFSKLRWTLANLAIYARNAGHRGPSTGKHAYFDLEGNTFHRYLTIFMHFLAIRGYSIHLRARPGSLGSWASQELFRQIKDIRLYFRDANVPSSAWLFTDHPVERPHVRLDPDYFAGYDDDVGTFRLPMPMVDTFYFERTHDREPRDPAEVRERGLFFFGNMDPEHYDRPELEEAFGCLNRHRLLQAVRTHAPHRIHISTDLDEVHVHDGKDIVLMGRQQRYIKPSELRPVLERFDFFLAPSGVVMPLCHNVVEAMSVGCIPILQYAHLMEPALRNGEECLSFNTSEELFAILDKMPNMPVSEVERMRRNVLRHYQRHLTPQAVIGKLEEKKATLERVQLNAEWPSTLLLLQRKRAASTDLSAR